MNVSGKTQWRIPPVLGLMIGVAASSTASTFIRLSQGTVPSLAVAAWRLTLASWILAPFALISRREKVGENIVRRRSFGLRSEWRNLSSREWALMIASGVILAAHFYTWISSLALTSVAASVVLVSTTPLFVALISHFFLDERISRLVMFGIGVAVGGSIIIGIGDVGQGSHGLIGDVLALAGALAAAGYMLIGRQLRGRLSLLGYVFPVYGTAAITLMGLALLTGVSLSVQPSLVWVWLVLMALFPQIVGHSSINWALGHLPATYVALALLAEPIGSTFLAWLILRETPTWFALGGGVLILLGLIIATWKPPTEN